MHLAPAHLGRADRVLHPQETGELHPDTVALVEQVAQRVDATGIQAWFDLEPGDLLGDDAAHYEKVADTLDVWFDSG